MFEINNLDNALNYQRLCQQLHALTENEPDQLANMANCAALLWLELPDINWAGFYLFKDNDLVLGPFQGKPACTRIAMGKGVCGTAAQLRQTVLVADVHQFPGHIACDAASNSEIVVPLIKDGTLLGVLDIDSPQHERFAGDDSDGLEAMVAVLLQSFG